MDLEVEGPLQVSMVELLRAFRDVLSRVDKSVPMEITPEEINVGQRIVMLLDRLAAESPVEFGRLFGDATRRVEVVVTFLALLELLRRRLATARQSEPMGPIVIYRTVERTDETAESGAAAAGEALPAAASVADGMPV
jgi:segregation and condensation protein A